MKSIGLGNGQLIRLVRHPSSRLLAAMLLANGLGLGTAVLQARLLGPEGRGEVAMALVPGTILVAVLCFGLPDYFGRQAARVGRWNRLSMSALQLSSLVGLVSIPFYLLFIEWRAPTGSTIWLLLLVYALATPFATFGASLLAIAAGSGRMTLVAASKVLPGAVSLLGLGVLAIIGATPLSVGLVVAGAGLVTLMVPLVVRDLRPRGRIERSEQREGLFAAIRAWPGGVLALLNQRLDVLLVTLIASREEVGYYAVSATLAVLVTTLATAIAIPTQNRVAQGDVGAAAVRTSLAVSGTAVVAFLAFILLPWLVPLVLGSSFEPSIGIMNILLLAQVPISGAIVLNAALVGVGRPGIRVWSEGLAVAVMTIGGTAVYPFAGVEGVALVTIVARLISFMALVEICRNVINRAPRWSFMVPTSVLQRLSTGARGV